MKQTLFLSLFLLIATNHSASASGCSGADWITIEKEALPSVKILTDYRGTPEVIFSAFDRDSAHIEYLNLGTRDERITFYSGEFSLKDIDVLDLIIQLRNHRPYYIAQMTREVTTNDRDDDCEELPAGTKIEYITHSFEIQLANGKKLKMYNSKTTEL